MRGLSPHNVSETETYTHPAAVVVVFVFDAADVKHQKSFSLQMEQGV